MRKTMRRVNLGNQASAVYAEQLPRSLSHAEDSCHGNRMPVCDRRGCAQVDRSAEGRALLRVEQ